MLCTGAIVVILAALAVVWVRPILRGRPHLWVARRCLKVGQRPGTRRFWLRFRSSHSFVIQKCDAHGSVRSVTLLALKFSQENLRTMARQGNPPWRPLTGGIDGFEIDVRHYEPLPRLGTPRVELRAEIRQGIGVVFVAERL